MRIKFLAAVLACMALLSACSGKVDLSKVTESTVGVNADGSIDEVIIESFDASYYTLEGLTAFVEEEVDAFNGEYPQEQPENLKEGEEITAITVQSVEANDEQKTARLAMAYLDAELYNLFNGANLQVLTIKDAAAQDTLTDLEYTEVKTGETIRFNDFADSSKLHIVCTDAAMRIQTGGKILYHSKEITLIDSHTVQTAEGLSVIVFK